MAFVAFLKKYYEKLILGALLLVFIGLLIYLGVLVRKTENLNDSAWEKNAQGNALPDLHANYKAKARKEKPEVVLETNLKRWEKKKEVIRGYSQDEKTKKVLQAYDFVIPAALTICPECRKAIHVADFENKNKHGQLECSLAGHLLRPPSVLVTVKNAYMDSDGDNIPDEYENRFQKSGHPFNANDKSDAALDFDNDYFSNLDEYYCDLDPLNPKINPLKNGPCGTFKGRLPYHYLLSCAAVARKKYSFEIAYVDVAKKTVDIKINKRIPEEIRRRTRSRREFSVERLRGLAIGASFQSKSDVIQILDITEKVPANSRLRVRFVKLKDVYSGDVFEVKNGEGNAEDRRNKAYIQTPFPRAALVFKGGRMEKKAGEKIELGKTHTGIDVYTVKSVNENNGTVTLKTSDGKDVVIGRATLFSKVLSKARAEKDAKKNEQKNSQPKQEIRARR